MEDFQSKIYTVQRENPADLKRFIASFAPVVDKAIIRNDWAAIKIRDDILIDLVSGICAVARRLDLKDKTFCVGFVGSGWRIPRLKERVKKGVQREFPSASFSKNEDLSGVYGAVLMAHQFKV